jgi:hypothetical protein
VNQKSAIVFLTLIVLLASDDPSGSAQDKSSGKSLVVSLGDVTKIDLKKRVLTLRSPFAQISSPTTSGQGGGRRGGGGGGRGSAGIGGRSIGRPEFNVYCTDKTTLKEGDQMITLEDIKVGNEVSVTGTSKGHGGDIEATEVTRSPSQKTR